MNKIKEKDILFANYDFKFKCDILYTNPTICIEMILDQYFERLSGQLEEQGLYAQEFFDPLEYVDHVYDSFLIKILVENNETLNKAKMVFEVKVPREEAFSYWLYDDLTEYIDTIVWTQTRDISWEPLDKVSKWPLKGSTLIHGKVSADTSSLF